jgi:large subunit ribosomal protein L24
MKVKKGDKVIVVTGKEKGKTGIISRVLSEKNQVIIDGLNLKKKHQKANREGKTGQIIEIAAPFNASNVMVLDPKTKKRTRVGKKLIGEKFVRIARKSESEIK